MINSSTLKPYLNFQILSVLFLGFASGAPLALTASTLQTWLTEVGVSLEAIGMFALVSLPYSLKFIWAPFIDYFNIPILTQKLGRRVSWIIIIQLLLIMAIIGLGNTDPHTNIHYTRMFALLVAFLSASQDIVIDAYRVELFESNKQGIATSMAIAGYRIGLLFATAGALILSNFVSWSVVYAIVGLSIILGGIVAIINGEPSRSRIFTHHADFISRLKESVIDPFLSILSIKHVMVILLFILCYKLGDAMIGVMTQSFLLREIGFTKLEIAAIVKTYGFFATLVGSFAGGAMVYKLGMLNSLIICGILQMFSNLVFLLLSLVGHDHNMLILTISIENIASGMGGAALIAYMTSLCNVAYTATHYALLSALAGTARTVLSAPAGYLVSYAGWKMFFVLSTFAALPGIILIFVLKFILSNKASNASTPN